MHTTTVPRGVIRRYSAGFSLLEMLIVVAIIGLIAALVVPRLGSAFGKSQVRTTRAQLAQLTQAVEQFRLDVNRYPTAEEGLSVLLEGTSIEGWDGPYLQKREIPTDAWGNPFVYRPDEEFEFIILSYGADGAAGGDGEGTDLDNRS